MSVGSLALGKITSDIAKTSVLIPTSVVAHFSCRTQSRVLAPFALDKTTCGTTWTNVLFLTSSIEHLSYQTQSPVLAPLDNGQHQLNKGFTPHKCGQATLLPNSKSSVSNLHTIRSNNTHTQQLKIKAHTKTTDEVWTKAIKAIQKQYLKPTQKHK